MSHSRIDPSFQETELFQTLIDRSQPEFWQYTCLIVDELEERSSTSEVCNGNVVATKKSLFVFCQSIFDTFAKRSEKEAEDLNFIHSWIPVLNKKHPIHHFQVYFIAKLQYCFDIIGHICIIRIVAISLSKHSQYLNWLLHSDAVFQPQRWVLMY